MFWYWSHPGSFLESPPSFYHLAQDRQIPADNNPPEELFLNSSKIGYGFLFNLVE